MVIKSFCIGSKKKFDESIKCFDKVIEIKADHYKAWYYKALNLAICKKYLVALKSINQAIQLKPDESEYWKSKGEILVELGRRKEANECFKLAYELKEKK